MSTLRTPRVDQVDQPTTRDEERRSPEQQTTQPVRLFVLVGISLLMVSLIGIFGLGALLTRGAPDPAAGLAMRPTLPPTVGVEPTLPPSTPTPDCISGQQQLALIEELERRGEWAQAAVVANATLDLPKLCAADRPALTQKAVGASLKALMDAPHRKTDTVQHQQLVDQYFALHARARAAGVPAMPALQFAEEAHGRSQFLLAKVAIEQALQAGEYQPKAQRDVTRLYVSALYGLCYWYTTAEQGSETYRQGLAFCVASDRLADAFCTGQGEAATKLNELVGTDRRRWPVPQSTPLNRYVGEGCT